MNLLPVVGRELRVSARQPFTYSMRMLGVGALIAVVMSMGVTIDLGPRLGAVLFTRLHAALMVAVWVLVPVLTADCISRERREGTLALLSLTALSFRDVAWAKLLAQGLRAFSLWLAVVPVMALPLMAGGVGFLDVLFSVLLNFSSILLALVAGLAASSRGKSFVRSLSIGGVIATALLVLLAAGLGFGATASLAGGPAQFMPWSDFGVSGMVLSGFGLAFNGGGVWQYLAARVGSRPILLSCLFLTCLSLLVFLLLMRFVAYSIKKAWHEEPPSARVLWLEQKLCTPIFFRGFLRWWMRRKLFRNPLGWLEQRTWSGRLVMWSWFAVVVSFYSAAFSGINLIYQAFEPVQVMLAWLLVGSIGLSACGSFRRERETGVLELLLVSPLTESQIIYGRVRGLWAQFMPAIALLYSVWVFLGGLPGFQVHYAVLIHFLVTFATLPVIGLYFSLAVSNYIGALLRTMLLGIAVPMAFASVGGYSGVGLLISATIQAGLAYGLAWRMHSKLARREFALERV